jgi:NAD(P)-dependent dehydrogenase (short-subunit alcohol dehydrogenase family)
MIAHGRGSITLMGSIDGLSAHAGRSHHVASKFAVAGLTKNLALECGRHGIRVNCIAPSFVDSSVLRHMTPAAYLEHVVRNRTPMGRMAQAEEIATATLMLLSDAASFVTGVELPVDGGLSVGCVTNACGADGGWNAPI